MSLLSDWFSGPKQRSVESREGVLIVDDYFYWSGNRDAVAEYLDRHKIPVLLTKFRRRVIGVPP